MLTTRYSSATADAQTQAVTSLLDGGSLRLYTGLQPRGADSHVADSVRLIVELRFGSPAFAASSSGIAVAFPLQRGYALISGKAGWFRTLQADGTPVFDGGVGLESDSPNLALDQLDIEEGTLVRVDAFSYRSPLA